MNGFALGERRPYLSVRFIVLASVVLFVGFFTLVPLFSVVWNSFKPLAIGNVVDFSLGNFTLENYRFAYLDPEAFIMLANSFTFAFGSMVVAFLLGGTIAVLVERTNIPFKSLIYGLVLVPLITPGILKAISWVLLLNPNVGLLNLVWKALGASQPLFNDESILAMMWVQGISMTPITFLLFGASLRMMDPALEEAAYASGAGKWRVFIGITARHCGRMPPLFCSGSRGFRCAFDHGIRNGVPGFQHQYLLCDSARVSSRLRGCSGLQHGPGGPRDHRPGALLPRDETLLQIYDGNGKSLSAAAHRSGKAEERLWPRHPADHIRALRPAVVAPGLGFVPAHLSGAVEGSSGFFITR